MKKRRGLLFMPGNNPGMLSTSVILGADTVIFDLEDSVIEREKTAARLLTRNALRTLKRRGVELLTRLNGLDTPFWRDDVDAAVSGGADGLVLPKCESRDHVHSLARAVEEDCTRHGRTGRMPLFLILETALGIERAYDIGTAHPDIAGLFFGGEDLATDLGVRRTREGDELIWGRSRMVNAAKAAGVTAIDTVFSDVDDLEGLALDSLKGRQLGYDGKCIISPQQINIVNSIFQPSEEELEWARRVLAAEKIATRDGKGAVSLDGKMVDMPIIVRARRIMEQSGEMIGCEVVDHV